MCHRETKLIPAFLRPESDAKTKNSLTWEYTLLTGNATGINGLQSLKLKRCAELGEAARLRLDFCDYPSHPAKPPFRRTGNQRY